MAGAAREARALMGSAAGDAQAASSGKAGGGGKGGEGGALRGAPAGEGSRAPASCSRRIWCCSCWIFRGSLGGRERGRSHTFREGTRRNVRLGQCGWVVSTTFPRVHVCSCTPCPVREAQVRSLKRVACN